jgi:succinate dehydrogenase / fumarate reductase cytochrome b subunit
MSRYTLSTSIFNRITGVGLSLGLLVLVYWLMAAASGARAYTLAQQVLSLGVFKLLYFGLLIAFSYHLTAGIRHLVWDTGHGMERAQAKLSAAIVVVVSILLAVSFGYWLFVVLGRAQ